MSQFKLKSNLPQSQDKVDKQDHADDNRKNSNLSSHAKPEQGKYFYQQNQQNRNEQKPPLEQAKPEKNVYVPKSDSNKSQFQQEGPQYGEKYSKVKPYHYDEEQKKSQRKGEKERQNSSALNNQIIGNFVKRLKSGVIVKIARLSTKVKVAQRIYIEVRNEANVLQHQKQSRLAEDSKRTKEVDSSDPKWDENFFYNSSKVLDDNITFILRNSENQEIARSEIRNFSKRNAPSKKEQIQKKEIELKNQDRTIGILHVEVSFFENGDLVGGIKIPQLSLKPPKDFKPKYNAVDGYNAQFSSQKGRKANCFNFLDGDTIPGFDSIEAFPSKFIQPNKRKNVV